MAKKPQTLEVLPQASEENKEELFSVAPSPSYPIDFGTGPAPEDLPVDALKPEYLADLPSARSDTEKVNSVLGGLNFPISEEHVKSFRLDLADLTIEEQVDLAREAHNTIGKASGYLPDFNSQTENMKSAYMKIVREIWLAAQRKARTFDE